MSTAYSEENASFSLAAHNAAVRDVYPHVFGSFDLRWWDAVGTDDDLRRGIDYRVGVPYTRVDNRLQWPVGQPPLLSFAIQERWRNERYLAHEDVTITEFCLSTGQLSEMFKVEAGLFVYGFYAPDADRIVKALVVDMQALRLAVARRSLFGRAWDRFGVDGQGAADETFLAFDSTDLAMRRLLFFRYPADVSPLWRARLT